MLRKLLAAIGMLICFQFNSAYAGTNTISCRTYQAGDADVPYDVRNLMATFPNMVAQKCVASSGGTTIYSVAGNLQRDASGVCRFSVREARRDVKTMKWILDSNKHTRTMRTIEKNGSCPPRDDPHYTATVNVTDKEFLIFDKFLSELANSRSNVESALSEFSPKGTGVPSFMDLQKYLLRLVGEKGQPAFYSLSKRSEGEKLSSFPSNIKNVYQLGFEGDDGSVWYLYCALVNGSVRVYDFSLAVQ